MSEASSRGFGGTIRDQGGNAIALAAADWLCLAATPAFAAMALVTAAGGGAANMLCSAVQFSPLSGMAPMYLLMSAFHAAPWLRLASRSRGGVRGSAPMRRS